MPASPSNHNIHSITFVHTADWQLGKPFAGITNPAKRARVQQERFEVIRRIAAVVRERQARFVVVAGDLFDSPTPTHDTISAALGAIAELGVPVFAIPGNHDHGGPDSLWERAFFQRERARLAPNLHLLTAATPTVVTLPDRGDGQQAVTLLPCPLPRRREADDPTAWIRDFDFSECNAMPRIVIAHGSVASFAAGGSARLDEDDDLAAGTANTIAIDRLPLDELDYAALGDWHGFMAAGSNAWYSGSPEIDRFPKARQEPGHVACVTVGRGLPPTVAAIRTGRFRWLSLDVVLDAGEDISGRENAGVGVASSDEAATGRGPAYLDAVVTEATRPQAEGEPGFDGCLAKITVTGTVSLAGRAELDRVIESWEARLLRLDLDDSVRIAPTPDEIRDLAARPGDPIISRVAAELVRRLEPGVAGAATTPADLEVVRHALTMLHGLAHPSQSATTITSTGAKSA
jgi:DNA repair exonuclease SbcCD nuclease subunit